MAELGGYELEELIGRGSIGVVFRARTRAGGSAFALKWLRLSPGAHRVGCLREELEAIGGLNHPHIIKVEALLEHEEGLIVVSQLAKGGSLGDVTGRRARLPPAEAADLVSKVAAAVASAHELSILHGDIKPSNVLLNGQGEPLVSDFGLSRWTAEGASWGRPAGATIGTAEYLDPAVAAGAGPTVASDVYSLGVLCYEVLTGRLPYQGATPSATLRAAARASLEPLVSLAPDVSADLADVVERAMSRRPRARPSTAGELATALRTAAYGGATSHSSTTDRVSAGDCAGVLTAVTGPRVVRPRRAATERRLREGSWLGRRSTVATIGAAFIAVLLPVLVGAWLLERGQPAHRTSVRCSSPTVTSPQEAGAVRDGVTLFADVAGNGCQHPVTRSGGIVSVSFATARPPARFALGQAGDQLLLGHWDCQRRATPALYRPGTGQVFYYAKWAQPGEEVEPDIGQSTNVIDGEPHVVRGGGRCDRVQVDPMQRREGGVTP
jgi:hypothetical protein